MIDWKTLNVGDRILYERLNDDNTTDLLDAEIMEIAGEYLKVSYNWRKGDSLNIINMLKSTESQRINNSETLPLNAKRITVFSTGDANDLVCKLLSKLREQDDDDYTVHLDNYKFGNDCCSIDIVLC